MLPSFIIIGAMKAGTSSLYRYLDAHPDICMSTVKETNFFLRDCVSGKDLESYQALFPRAAKVYGEASPNYTKRHLHPGVPARIHETIPDVKLIYLLRDPIDRLLSHYVHNLTHGRERRSLADALASVDRNNLILTSQYYYQLEPFLDYFSDDRILIVTTDELISDRRTFLQRIYEFLNVPHHCNDGAQKQIHNSSSERRAMAFLNQHVRSRKLKRFLGRGLPAALIERALPPRPRLEEAARERLKEHLAPDVARLRSFTGQRFEHWCL